MNSQDEVIQELRKKSRTLWLSAIFFAFVTMVGVMTNSIILTVIGLLFVVGGIYGIHKFKGFAQNELADYRPGIGFEFFRKSKGAKLTSLTYAQYGIAVIILLSIWFRLGIAYALIYGGIGILFIQFFLKRRITLHTQIDDASLFELEELGVIGAKDIVKALYKDFESWGQVQPGNKLLLVNQDVLICIVMNKATEANRMDIRLKEIKKMGILGTGEQGEGLLVSIGTADNQVVRLKLEGNSFQDSPEEFIRYFLQALDEALLTSQKGTVVQRDQRGQRVAVRMEGMPQKTTPVLTIRELDFQVASEMAEVLGSQSTGAAVRHLDL